MHIHAICGSFCRRVWHPCHTHAALPGGAAVSAAPTKQTSHILPQISQISQIFRSRFCLLICAHPCNLWEFFVGGYGIPAIPTPPAMIVFSHGTRRTHRSLGGAAVPSYTNRAIVHQPRKPRIFSHRFHRFPQIFRLRFLPPNLCTSAFYVKIQMF